jgi:hypothetical protein
MMEVKRRRNAVVVEWLALPPPLPVQRASRARQAADHDTAAKSTLSACAGSSSKQLPV